MNQTIDITVAAPSSTEAYNEACGLLGRLGWNVTHWYADELITREPFHVWRLTVEVTAQQPTPRRPPITNTHGPGRFNPEP